jgi:hypothetical protein
MAARFQIPDLSNMTPEGLIDEIGKQKAMFNYLKKSIATHEEALYTRVKGGKEGQVGKTIRGESFEAQWSGHQMTIVDQPTVKEKFPMDTHPELYKVNDVVTGRYTFLKDPELNAWLQSLRAELGLDD